MNNSSKKTTWHHSRSKAMLYLEIC